MDRGRGRDAYTDRVVLAAIVRVRSTCRVGPYLACLRHPRLQRAAQEMGERPPGAAVQAEASNRPPLLRLRGVVVSRWETAGR